jgi:methylmalonyl-CoA epimerase
VKIEKVDHIGISVKDMDAAMKFYVDIIGIKKSDISEEGIPGKMRLATVKIAGANLELVQYMDKNDKLYQYADANSDSIHHVAMYVDDIEEALSTLKKSGGTLLHEKPMKIPNGLKVAFALPKDSKVVIEFMEA